MNPVAEGAVSALFFIALLGASSALWGRNMGSPARGALIPLLMIPIVSDWIRYVFPVSFPTAWIFSIIIYASGSAGFYLRYRRSITLPWQFSSRRWWFAFAVILGIHVVLRCWIFTGSVPNPSDDIYAGYKASALYHASGWVLPHPEAPEIPFNYYYYPFSWVAGLSSVFHTSFWSGWWATAVVLSVVGGMLVLEFVLPRLKRKIAIVCTALILVNGASFSWLVPALSGNGPKDWGNNVRSLVPHGLYFKPIQQLNGFWAPFVLFCTGCLFIAVLLLIRMAQGRISARQIALITLIVGGLAGYCAFFLIGWVVIVVPVFLFCFWRHPKQGTLVRGLLILGTAGILALVACWPVLHEFLMREAGVRDPNYNPIFSWLSTNSPAPATVAYALGIMVFAILIGNPLSIAVIATTRRNRLPTLYFQIFFGIFLWGTLLCCTGVTNDFVPKFGVFIALCGVVPLAFLRVRSQWMEWMILCALVGPVLILTNTIRANITLPKASAISRILDEQIEREPLPVLYRIGAEKRVQRSVWLNMMPHFSRALIFTDTVEIDVQGRNFMRGTAALDNLPPLPQRPRLYLGKRTAYYLLSAPASAHHGRVIYQDNDFVLSREEP